MRENLQKTAEYVLETAAKKGNIKAEVFLLDSEEMTIEVAGKKVENMKIAQECGLGLRVIKEGRLGFAYTSDLSKTALKSVVEKAVNNSQETQADSSWDLPQKKSSYITTNIYDEKTFQIPVEQKIILAQSIEEAAQGYDERIAIIEKAVYQESRYMVIIQNSMGLLGDYQGSYCGAYAVVVGRQNEDSQTGFAMYYGLKYPDISPLKIGREAGEKAVRMLGAKMIPSENMPIVFDPYIATKFLGAMQTAFSAEAMQKGKSFLIGKEGKTVASPLITIIDDGTLPERLGTAPFDGEGVPTARTVLLEKGCLKGFLHNQYTAAKSGTKSTGNGIRGSYKSTPEVGCTNLYMHSGDKSPQEILKEIKKGLYVTEVLGMHTVNPVSGDFSLGAAGLLIENGELTTPVKGVAIAGNLKEMLTDIDAVGNDLTFFIGKGAPTIRVKAMSISGM